MKINRIGKNLTLILTDGTFLSHSKCDDTLFETVIALANKNEEEKIKAILRPKLEVLKQEVAEKIKVFKNFKKSEIMTVFGNSIYLKEISQLTLPIDLATAIFKAEEAGNKDLIETYCNFWTLCCLNPDSRARTNLFWFLNKYGMTISKSGLFIAYRNVELKKEGSQINAEKTKGITSEYARIKFKHKKSPSKYILVFADDAYKAIEEKKFPTSKIRKGTYDKLGNLQELYDSLSKPGATVYTDQFTKKMEITIGEPVTIEREKCDAKQENTCSRGLHVASKSWLQGSFGKISLLVLVNPADVVAVPPQDNYGKMRTCCYFPVKVIGASSTLKDDIEVYPDGFEDDFMNLIAYDGTMSNEESFQYTLEIPEIPEISRSKILSRLKEISGNLKKII